MADSRRSATLIGFTAVLMWSLLAMLTAASGRVPPFQLTAMAFAISGLLGLVWIVATGRMGELVLPARAWLLGVGGLFGFHFFYFTALRAAPPVEASLVAYLWPLLIVVFSALLPGERLRWYHLAGALLGLVGTFVVVSGGRELSIDPRFLAGYAAALAAALTWSAYSVLSRRFATVRTGAVAGFCLATAALSAIAHLALEETAWPAGSGEWLAVVGLGLMPVGAAFYVWDHGVKHGDIQILGTSAYAAPLLSTLVLILAGYAVPDWSIAAAAVLITGGAMLASKDALRRR
ncbi:MAG: EamA family transporter [Bauldia sp.]|uniref:aromatic amino acid exporter YddG n=1 Tax=Bauldia sp. TaxID=2575872 RepID=UPI001DA496F6|nr:EamA family transporter [Bauldia sp.]MCB1496190.1 EamA family transporter [Bauldia sp.]